MERILRVFNKPAVRIVEGLLALFFFYLAAIKLFDSHEVAHLTAIGVSEGRRVATAVFQMIVGVLLIVGASGYVTAPMVIAVAATEVLVFQRPPLVAAMCVGTHGLTTFLRYAHQSASVERVAQEGLGHRADRRGSNDYRNAIAAATAARIVAVLSKQGKHGHRRVAWW